MILYHGSTVEVEEPKIIRSEVVASAEELNMKAFEGPSLEWLNFIVKCRSDVNYEHKYDIVTGNIANDNVGETVSYVLQGIMRSEDAVERLKFEKINNQISFHTAEALKHLKFKEAVRL